MLKRLFKMLRPQRAAIVGAAIVLMAQAAALLAGPLLVAYGIDSGIKKHDGTALDHAVIVYLVMAFAGLALGRWAIIFVARIGEGFLRTCATASSATSCACRSTTSRPRRPVESSPA